MRILRFGATTKLFGNGGILYFSQSGSVVALLFIEYRTVSGSVSILHTMFIQSDEILITALDRDC